MEDSKSVLYLRGKPGIEIPGQFTYPVSISTVDNFRDFKDKTYQDPYDGYIIGNPLCYGEGVDSSVIDEFISRRDNVALLYGARSCGIDGATNRREKARLCGQLEIYDIIISKYTDDSRGALSHLIEVVGVSTDETPVLVLDYDTSLGGILPLGDFGSIANPSNIDLIERWLDDL